MGLLSKASSLQIRYLRGLALLFSVCLPMAVASAVQTPDEEYQSVAEEYIKGYLAARPLLGTSLGLHEYDGKIADFSRLSLDAELSHLRRFDDRLRKFDLNKLSARQSIDLRILQASIRRELFQRQDLAIFERGFDHAQRGQPVLITSFHGGDNVLLNLLREAHGGIIAWENRATSFYQFPPACFVVEM